MARLKTDVTVGFAITIPPDMFDEAATARTERALMDRLMLDLDTDIMFGPRGMQAVHDAPGLWRILTSRQRGLTWYLRLAYLRCLVRGHHFRLDRVTNRRSHTRVWCPNCTFEVYRRNDP